MEMKALQTLFILLIFVGKMNCNETQLACYVCKTTYDRTKPTRMTEVKNKNNPSTACELPQKKFLKICNDTDTDTDTDNTYNSSQVCLLEWKKDTNNRVISVERACRNKTSDMKLGCDGNNKDHHWICYCASERCNNLQFPNPAWLDPNYGTFSALILSLLIIIPSLLCVLTGGSIIYYYVNKKNKKAIELQNQQNQAQIYSPTMNSSYNSIPVSSLTSNSTTPTSEIIWKK